MLTRLVGRLRKTVTVTAAPKRFSFASARREAAIDTTVRVGADGRILGFGDSGATIQGQVMPVFGPGESATVAVDEQALVALCRRGFALVLGPWPVLRPRVVVRGAKRWGVPQEIFLRALREAGAEIVEFTD
jgi:hypothetical protein